MSVFLPFSLTHTHTHTHDMGNRHLQLAISQCVITSLCKNFTFGFLKPESYFSVVSPLSSQNDLIEAFLTRLGILSTIYNSFGFSSILFHIFYGLKTNVFAIVLTGESGRVCY